MLFAANGVLDGAIEGGIRGAIVAVVVLVKKRLGEPAEAPARDRPRREKVRRDDDIDGTPA